MDTLLEWLLEGDDWIKYNVYTQLMEKSDDNPIVMDAKKNITNTPKIQNLLEQVADWPGYPLKSHKDAKHPLHKLVFLSEIGLDSTNPMIAQTLAKIEEHISPEGLPEIEMNIPKHFGGTGEDMWVWMLCDTPILLYAMIKLGYDSPHSVIDALEAILSLVSPDGWECKVTSSLGKFRGPGRKGDPCPYVNLIILRLFSLFPSYHEHPAIFTAISTLLSLWTRRTETKPYLFAMGTDFKKLKVPRVWYDIVHVTDVLSQYPAVHEDPRFLEMIEILESKKDGEGKYIPESIYRASQGWEFGQKKIPSRWLTFIITNTLKRIGR